MSSISFSTPETDANIVCEYNHLYLIKKKKKIIDFYLEVICQFQEYQLIENKALFNLIPEVKNPSFDHDFSENVPLFIKLRLKKDLLAQILNQCSNEEQISQYLLNYQSTNLDEKRENSPLFANNWYCLETKQNQGEQTIAAQTLWHELDPQHKNSKKKASKTNKANIWNEESVAQMSADWEEAGEKIGQFFDDLIDTLDKNISEKIPQNQQISAIVKEFFRQDDWNYLQFNDGITLQLTAQGNNGQITCYARSYDRQNQFIFYSLYPQSIPEAKRDAIAQLITRINYGMIIGNLEMDFDDGELRYKTSIDVEGDRLTTDLVKRVIYANVLTMDQYLPAITAILEDECSIPEAIAKVE